MASLVIRAEHLAVGDVILLPYGEATVKSVRKVGPRTRYVSFTTEHGRTRIEVGREIMVKASVL